MERIETDWIGTRSIELPIAVNAGVSSFLTRVEVYQDSSCLIEEEFRKPLISIGRSTKSDIVLQDVRISRHHFYIYIENHQIFVFVLPGKQALSINSQPVKAALLDTDDTVEIGPYTLKIQIRLTNDRPQIEDDMRYQVVFEGQTKKGFSSSRVAKNLKKWLKINGQQTASLFSGKSVVVKQNLDLPEAIQFKKEFENFGAIGQVQAVINSVEIDQKPLIDKTIADFSDPIDEKPKNGESVVHLPNRTDEKPKNGKSAAQLNIQGLPLPDSALLFALASAGDEDDEEDDSEALFSLKEKLSTFGAYDRRLQSRAPSQARSIGVFKFRADAVIDVSYLNSKESYYINSNRGRFRLAQKNGSEKGYLYFNDNFTGTVRTKESGEVSISDFLIDDHLYRKRKGIYRLPIPDPGEVFVNDGCFDYLIRPVFPSQSPAVRQTRQTKGLSWKHGASSLLIHMVFLVVLTLLPISVIKQTSEPETRFVKVDPHILNRIQPKPKP
ncbi:MAG: FHA domain-containing protein, partial [Deltaproteobacteria bacterium]|nr:FHA domain-containing protein [Deltaproteobacteria bacterium]